MSDIRFFQVAVPILFVMYMMYQLNMVRLHRKEWKDLMLPIIVATMIMLVAIFHCRKIKSYTLLFWYKS